MEKLLKKLYGQTSIGDFSTEFGFIMSFDDGNPTLYSIILNKNGIPVNTQFHEKKQAAFKEAVQILTGEKTLPNLQDPC